MKIVLAAALLATVALAGCAPAPTVRANTDPSVDLATYRSYAFPANPGTDRAGYTTPITSYFKQAIRREMDARGYRYVESGDADLLINFNANAREHVEVRSTPAPAYGGYYGYRAGLYGVGHVYMAAPEIDTIRYKVGTANIDIVDWRKKQLVWEGVIEGRLTDKIMENPQAAVDAAVTEMFTKFPGRAGA
jgi:hypothetical protein